MTTNRKAARQKIATDLAGVLVGTGKPAQAVLNHRPFQITKTPLVFVTSAATEDNSPNHAVENVYFDYDIHTICLYSDEVAWHETNAEDALDDIEQIVRAYCRANRTLSGYWSHLQYDGPTNAADVDFDVDGVNFRHEIIRVRVHVEGG